MKLFEGVFTALVTPFRNGKIDEKSLRQLVDWQIKSGIHGLVPCGTTGESVTLLDNEKKEVIGIVLDQARKRVPVIAGTGTNNTAQSVELTRWAKEAGVDGALVVTPYYNKPSQEGLFQHFSALAEVGAPLVLYNVPGRTSVSLTVETLERLSQNKNIVALKEATASMDFATQIIERCGSQLTLLSGDDFTFLPFLSIGGKGVISVVSNIIPKEFSELYLAFKGGDMDQAQKIHFKYYPLIQSLFIDTNPVPVKTALSLMDKISLEFRLPLCETSPQNKSALKKTLQDLSLI